MYVIYTYIHIYIYIYIDTTSPPSFGLHRAHWTLPETTSRRSSLRRCHDHLLHARKKTNKTTIASRSQRERERYIYIYTHILLLYTVCVIQYNAIRCKTAQFQAKVQTQVLLRLQIQTCIRTNALHCTTLQCNTIRHTTIENSTTEKQANAFAKQNATQHHTMQYNMMQYNIT